MATEALKLALETLQFYASVCNEDDQLTPAKTAIAKCKAALAQPAQEPVAWRRREVGGRWQYFGWEETGMTYQVVERWNKNGFECEAIPATPPAQEPYDQTALELCNVCGWKTLIPNDGCLNCERKAQPAQQEALYGMNQDDWKDVVAAISKVRDGRGIYLGCRPADVFKDWFLALGTAKVKEKNNGT